MTVQDEGYLRLNHIALAALNDGLDDVEQPCEQREAECTPIVV
jgi:hypothetical protein